MLKEDLQPRTLKSELVFACLSLTVLLSACGQFKTNAVDPAFDCRVGVRYQQGNVPIVLTAPHDGNKHQAIAGVPKRMAPRASTFSQPFITSADAHTNSLSWRIAELLDKRYQLKPFIITFEVPRFQVDANRVAIEAYQHPKAGVCYRHYHQHLAQALAKVKTQWGQGVLLDIHGQARFPDHIIKGTRNGATIAGLIKRHPDVVLGETNMLFSRLRQMGYQVLPEKGSPEIWFTGGLTVVQYSQFYNIDAFQIELGRQLRLNSHRRETLAQDIATAIAGFYQDYYLP